MPELVRRDVPDASTGSHLGYRSVYALACDAAATFHEHVLAARRHRPGCQLCKTGETDGCFETAELALELVKVEP